MFLCSIRLTNIECKVFNINVFEVESGLACIAFQSIRSTFGQPNVVPHHLATERNACGQYQMLPAQFSPRTTTEVILMTTTATCLFAAFMVNSETVVGFTAEATRFLETVQRKLEEYWLLARARAEVSWPLSRNFVFVNDQRVCRNKEYEIESVI